MNAALIFLIFIPLLEIYLFIKIGAQIGAFNTVSLILITAIVGIYYAKYEGLNTLKSAITQLVSNKIPIYEILSGAALAIASFLLILPGFATDLIGLLLIIPFTRKFFFKRITKRFENKNFEQKNNFIDGEFEDIEDDNDKKL